MNVGERAVVIEADGRLDREDGRRAANGFIDVLDQRLGGVTVEEERREGRV